MNYFSGFPYSDELYHHGILGQKWGVRRYQNEDGTLTTAGKIRYGVKKAGSTIGKGLSTAGRAIGNATKQRIDHRITKYKDKHPWMMSDEELKQRSERIKAENAYKAELRKAQEPVTRGQKLVTDILETSAKTMASKAVDAFARKIFADKPEAVRALDEVLRDSNATIQEIQNAEKRYKIEQDYKKSKNLNRTYDESKINPDKMSRNELDNYNAWKKSRDSAIGKNGKNEKNDGQKNQANTSEKKNDSQKESAMDAAKRQQIHAQVEARKAEAQRQASERSSKLQGIRQSAESNAQNRLTAERKREVEQMVDNIFRKARIARADYKDSMTAYRRTAEYNAAKRRALQLAEEGSKITVGAIFYDGNMDG